MGRWVAGIALFMAATAQAEPSPGRRIPPAPIEGFQELLFGRQINDPYRWMERADQQPRLEAWLVEASSTSRARLNALPERAGFAALLDAATRAGTVYSNVTGDGDRLYFLRTSPGEAAASLAVRENGRDRVLLAPELADGAVRTLTSYSLSPNGRTVAVKVGVGGSEFGEIILVDVATGGRLPNVYGPVWGQQEPVWLGDDVLAYTRTPATPSGGDRLMDGRVMVARLGVEGAGQAVLGREVEGSPPFRPEEFVAVVSSEVSPLVLGVGSGARADARYLVSTRQDLIAGRPDWLEVADYEDHVASAAVRGDWVYTLVAAPDQPVRLERRRLCSDGLSASETVALPAGATWDSVVAGPDGVYVSGLDDGRARLMRLGVEGAPAVEIALPAESSLRSLQVDTGGKSLIAGLVGWNHPVAYFKVAGHELAPIGLASEGWTKGVDDVQVRREEAVSADGTRVPLVILSPRNRGDEPRPALLHGYGSYGAITTQPFYHVPALPWVVRGGVGALCGARGGGERGRAWHEAGRYENKVRGQEDFIACAERLVELGYTTPGGLVATGTSAGGVLVPPAAMRRPDLFTAMVPRVALLNPTRLEAATNGVNQFSEMGDPRTAEGFSILSASDSYLLLEQVQDIPDTLVTVGLNDQRVAAWLGGKFVARAAARFGERRDILIRAEDAGHGFGTTRDQLVSEWADILAFAWDQAAPAIEEAAR